MLQKNAGLPPSARLSVKDIYERVRDEEGFLGGYSTVSDYVRPAASDEDCIWEQPYDLLISLEKKRVFDFLVLLSRADPPVISPARRSRASLPQGCRLSRAVQTHLALRAHDAAIDREREVENEKKAA
jgi:hypothetical protein